MKIAYVTAGAAGMYCGSCMQDNVLVKGLQERGAEAILIPTYTPVRTDLHDVSMNRIFFGGINVFLQQKIPIFRYTPAFIDRLFNHPRLLRWVSRFSSSTNATDLGSLAVSVLRAEEGHQRKALKALIQWLKDDYKPDVVHLTNSMFAGFARMMKQELNCPVVCTLQGEDLFLDAMIQPYKDEAREVLYERAADVDAFVVHSQYYQKFMSDYLAVPEEKIHVVRLGMNLVGHGEQARSSEDERFTVGYLARVCPEKGIHIAIEAFRQFVDMVGRENTRLRIAGHLTPIDTPFLEEQMKKVNDWGLGDLVAYEGELDRPQKLQFLADLDAFTVPAPYKEPKGRYVLEALANAVPVVQPDHGAFTEMIQKTGGGMLVPPDSPKEIARGLKHLYDHRQEAKAMGARGQEVVFKDYRVQELVQEIEEIYQNLTRGQDRINNPEAPVLQSSEP